MFSLVLAKQWRELLDIESDLGETTNVIGSHPDIANALKQELVTIVKNDRSRTAIYDRTNAEMTIQSVVVAAVEIDGAITACGTGFG